MLNYYSGQLKRGIFRCALYHISAIICARASKPSLSIANAAKDDARIARRDAALDSVKLFLASISNPLLLVLWVLS